MTGQQSDTAQRSARHTLTTLGVLRSAGRGVVGGLVATVLMTLYRFPTFRAVPPTAEFWATYVAGGRAEEYPIEGLALHLLYGGAAGGLLGLAFSLVDVRTARSRRFTAVTLAVGYSLLLSVFGTRVVFRRLLGEELDDGERMVFHTGHVIFGLSLGTWLQSREGRGEVYE
ncbi:hypothetical protein [Halolamina salifodinae]|uniref:Uncharacterized protein n=1 Tax=Halolamina salifodinae TaxID=1202767 RepID=A0A8T4GZ78_9EURY|nr:hypothetical protein [Halolamina salifodinae]MBP1987443.1 hypothetical protein [Halolamina salifodinae]